MKKKIATALTCLMMCSVFLINGITAHAVIGQGDDMLDFYVPYSKPTGENQGYLSVVLERDGLYKLETYFWNIVPYEDFDSGSGFVHGFANIGINNNVVTVELANGSDSSLCVANLFLAYESNGYTRMDFMLSEMLSFSGDPDGGDIHTYTLDYKNYGQTIIGYEIGGNGLVYEAKMNGVNKVPTIHWNEEVGLDVYQDIMTYLMQIYTHTGNLNNILLSSRATRQAVEDIRDSLKLQLDSIEQEQMNDFKNNSGVQSDELTSLNQQNQLEKPDVDSVSQQVDSVLDVEMDANYGMLLSSLTNNNRILTMMLVCSAVALISFVLFGKR